MPVLKLQSQVSPFDLESLRLTPEMLAAMPAPESLARGRRRSAALRVPSCWRS